MDGNSLYVLNEQLRELLIGSLRDRAPELLDGRVAVAPDSASPRIPTGHPRVPVSVGGLLCDVELQINVTPHTPPGWAKPPRHPVRTMVVAAGILDPTRPDQNEWVVEAVLGTRDDPRPGYYIAPLQSAQDGRRSRGAGSSITVPVDLFETSRSIGELP